MQYTFFSSWILITELRYQISSDYQVAVSSHVFTLKLVKVIQYFDNYLTPIIWHEIMLCFRSYLILVEKWGVDCIQFTS